MATNLALNHLTRYRKRWRLFSELRPAMADQDSPVPELEVAPPDALLAELDMEHRRALIDGALHKLPEHQRLALVLYHFEELSYAEIAIKLRASLAKVKTDKARPRRIAASFALRRHRRLENRMSMNDPDEALERLFDRSLHELPLRRAPPTLESSVLRELERRAALPWWRRSFKHWPLPPRVAFIVICCALIRAAFLGGALVISGLRSLTWTRHAGALMASAGNVAALLARSAPPVWIYEGIAVCAVLYAILFGLGAVLYRTLYLQPTAGMQ